MMGKLLLLLLIVCTVSAQFCEFAPSNPEDRRENKDRLRVVTFNVEWLFLERDTSSPWVKDKQEMEHLENIAEIILEIDGDIVVMPETENCNVLNVLLGLDILKDKGYKPYVLKGTDSATGQNVALISRIDPSETLKRTSARHDYPIFGNTCDYTYTGNYGVSKHFYAPFDIIGIEKPILLVGLHFLAFPTNKDRCAKREAQATVIRDIIEEEGLRRDREVIVLGDFNDYDKDVLDADNSMPNSRVLSILKGVELANIGKFVTKQSDRYSSWYDRNKNCIDDGGNEHTTIDHIIMSENLQNKIAKVSYEHVFKAGCDSIKSDHWPIIVDIDTSSKVINQNASPVTFDVDNNSSPGQVVFIIVLFVAVVLALAIFVAIAAIFGLRRYRRRHFENV